MTDNNNIEENYNEDTHKIDSPYIIAQGSIDSPGFEKIMNYNKHIEKSLARMNNTKARDTFLKLLISSVIFGIILFSKYSKTKCFNFNLFADTTTIMVFLSMLIGYIFEYKATDGNVIKVVFIMTGRTMGYLAICYILVDVIPKYLMSIGRLSDEQFDIICKSFTNIVMILYVIINTLVIIINILKKSKAKKILKKHGFRV